MKKITIKTKSKGIAKALNKALVIKSVCKHELILPSDDWTYVKCANCGEPV